jgi:hypothetical protein
LKHCPKIWWVTTWSLLYRYQTEPIFSLNPSLYPVYPVDPVDPVYPVDPVDPVYPSLNPVDPPLNPLTPEMVTKVQATPIPLFRPDSILAA